MGRMPDRVEVDGIEYRLPGWQVGGEYGQDYYDEETKEWVTVLSGSRALVLLKGLMKEFYLDQTGGYQHNNEYTTITGGSEPCEFYEGDPNANGSEAQVSGGEDVQGDGFEGSDEPFEAEDFDWAGQGWVAV